MSILIVGCGYLGLRAGRRWLADGEEVFALTRSESRAASLSEQGFKPLLGDVTVTESLAHFPPISTLLFAVGFDRQAGPSIDEVYVQGLKNVLNQLTSPAPRVIYISSTGVYGPGGEGAWVDESSDCNPTRPGGKASLAAESVLSAHPNATNHVILRMAGIYGPGRLPLAAQIQSGEPIPAEPEAYLNLIHIEDAAQVTVTAAKAQDPANCYCVSDGQPVLRKDFYAELARLLHAPVPSFAAVDQTAGSARRGSGDKRISNARLLKELPVSFQYPTYQAGLAAICAEQETS